MGARLIQDTRGVAAIEFALILPVLVFMLIALWDISNFANEKMRLEQTIRAVASNAVAGVDSVDFNDQYLAIINEFYPDASAPRPTLAVSTSCACSGVTAGCYDLCASGETPDRLVSISATILVDGPVLGDRNAQGSLDVKIR